MPPMIIRLVRRSALALTLATTLVALPAQAAVTITFWSRDMGRTFPHAYITLRGVPDGGGEPVDTGYGFTVKTVTPALLLGSVSGTIERPTIGYQNGSDAQFSVVLSDAQYAAELALVAAWDKTRGGDSRYNLNTRNCIHFVKAAARIAGLTDLDRPKLMKKPRRYLEAIATANRAAITPIGQPGSVYLATLPPVSAPPARRGAPDLHVLPPSPPGQPIGTISTRSRVDSNPG